MSDASTRPKTSAGSTLDLQGMSGLSEEEARRRLETCRAAGRRPLGLVLLAMIGL